MRGALREACQARRSCTWPQQPSPPLLHSITALHHRHFLGGAPSAACGDHGLVRAMLLHSRTALHDRSVQHLGADTGYW